MNRQLLGIGRMVLCAFLLLYLSFGFLYGQSARSYDLNNFTGLRIRGGHMRAEVTPSDTYSVHIEAFGNNSLEDLEVGVTSGVLLIERRSDRGSVQAYYSNRNYRFRIRISMPELRSVEMAGSGDLYVRESWTSSELSVSLSGAWDLEWSRYQGSGSVQISAGGASDVSWRELECQNLDIDLAGSCDGDFGRIRLSGDGDVDLRGASDLEANSFDFARLLRIGAGGSCDVSLKSLRGEELQVSLSGASELDCGSGRVKRLGLRLGGSCDADCSDLKSGQVQASLSGASEAEVYATESLQVDGTRCSSLSYRGSPKLEVRGRIRVKRD